MKKLTIILILLLGIMLIYYNATHPLATIQELISKFWFFYFAMTVGVVALIIKWKK